MLSQCSLVVCYEVLPCFVIGSQFQRCVGPYIQPVSDRIGHLSGLGSKFVQVNNEAEQKYLVCRQKWDFSCFIAAAQNATAIENDIGADVLDDLKELVPEGLLAKGAVASCGTASAFDASEEMGDASDDAIQCLRNI